MPTNENQTVANKNVAIQRKKILSYFPLNIFLFPWTKTDCVMNGKEIMANTMEL